MAEITLHQFAKDLGTESASPFCVKVHRALGLKGLEYKVRNVGSPQELKRLNPDKRKLPVLEVDGTLIPDSSRIVEYLDQKFPEIKVRGDEESWQASMLEDWANQSLYWYAVYYRWQISENFEPFAKRAFGKLPPPLRWFVPGLVRKQTIKSLRAQGIGRYDEAEVREQLRGHLARLARVLDDGEWMSGANLGSADLALFGLVRQFSLPSMVQTSPLVAEHPGLVAWLKAVDAKTSTEHTIAVE